MTSILSRIFTVNNQNKIKVKKDKKSVFHKTKFSVLLQKLQNVHNFGAKKYALLNFLREFVLSK